MRSSLVLTSFRDFCLSYTRPYNACAWEWQPLTILQSMDGSVVRSSLKSALYHPLLLLSEIACIRIDTCGHLGIFYNLCGCFHRWHQKGISSGDASTYSQIVSVRVVWLDFHVSADGQKIKWCVFNLAALHLTRFQQIDIESTTTSKSLGTALLYM